MKRPEVHIVDDDPDIRDGLVWLFDSRGYAPVTWDGGQAFLGRHAVAPG
jgi:two-component system response regulator DctR